MLYVHKKNGKVAELIEKNEKSKTVTLKFVDDGTLTGPTFSTFQRWWKALESPEVVQSLMDVDNPITEEEAKKLDMVSGDEAVELAVPDPDIAGDGTPLQEVGKEIAKQAKGKQAKGKQASKKKSKGTRARKEMSPEIQEAVDYVLGLITAQGDEVFVPANGILMRTFKVGGHMYAKFNYSCTSITLAISSKSEPLSVKEPDKIINHMFDYTYRFDSKLTGEDKKVIKKLLACARKYRVAKNSKKEEK